MAPETLFELSPGQAGTILSVSNTDKAVRSRLIDMGLTPGTAVTVKKIAPFGDPIEVMVRGYELSLRKSDAAQITLGSPVKRARTPAVSGVRYHAIKLDSETARRMKLDHEHELDAHFSYDGTAHDKRGEIKIALAGNPNSGKTTLFNALTGSDQSVGNWPGVTVEKKEGKADVGGKPVTVVDLPGIYSLSPYSLEEIVARDYILGEKPDAIINIVDATNLERNMYLTVSLLELERPMVLALNFMDEARKRGDVIDAVKLSEALGIPVVPITARSGENIEALLHAAHRQIHMGFTVEPDDLYDDFTHEIHHETHELIHDNAYAAGIPAHWASVKLIEGDALVESALALDDNTSRKVSEIAARYEAAGAPGDRETLVADSRYGYIEKVAGAALKRGADPDAPTISDKIDRIVTHKYLAVPVFLLAMLAIFALTFGPVGSWLSDSAGMLISDVLGVWLQRALAAASAPAWLISLCVDGVLAGVGGVLTFLPQIALLFLFLSFLEDSGYMARAAFIMDRLLRRFGLSGKAFIPMLMGFGCTVPAVMGARTMESEKDRRLTILLVPFMSCSAKLPVYGLIAAAFFGRLAGIAVFALYILGLLLAVVSGIIFKATVFKGEDAPFVLELPPYRMPTLTNTVLHVWEKVKGFLVRAGTVILVMSVFLWALQTFDFGFNMALDASSSMLGAIGGALAPIFTPLGFGVWQAAVALLTGIVAKEAVVASLAMFCGFSLTASNASVALALGSTFASPLAAFSFLVFILLYVPCVAAISTIRKEMNSMKWTLVSVAWQLGTAYAVSLVVYQLGSLLGIGI